MQRTFAQFKIALAGAAVATLYSVAAIVTDEPDPREMRYAYRLQTARMAKFDAQTNFYAVRQMLNDCKEKKGASACADHATMLDACTAQLAQRERELAMVQLERALQKETGLARSLKACLDRATRPEQCTSEWIAYHKALQEIGKE